MFEVTYETGTFLTSSHWEYILNLRIFTWLLPALLFLHGIPVLQARPWSISDGLLPPKAVDRLKERYPSIVHPTDLENLLRDIARSNQFLKLNATDHNGAWLVQGETATLVSDIEIDLPIRLLKQPALSSIQNYQGQVDSKETREQVLKTLNSFLEKKGYRQNRILLTPKATPEGTKYDIKIEDSQPCVISRLDFSVNLPKSANLGVSAGDICDIDEIRNNLATLEMNLRDSGYNQVRLDLGKVLYDKQKNSAVIIITGFLGDRIKYEIIDSTHKFFIDELFADDELTKIDPGAVGPDAITSELARRYKNKGYLDVIIKGPEIKKGDEGDLTYIFRVNPGPQYTLKSIQFEGVEAFPQSELLEEMGFDRLWQGERAFNQDAVQKGVLAIRAKYQAYGYWDAKIKDPGTGQKDKDTGSVRLTIQVTEGARRFLQGITVKGSTALTHGEISDLLKGKSGDPLDRGSLLDFQQAIQSSYVEKGYLYAQVGIELRQVQNRNKVDVTIDCTIQEGPRVIIGDISITGLTKTKEKVVRRHLYFSPGDWYEPNKINQSRTALTKLGIFRSVQIVPADRNALSDHARELDIIVDVREGKPGSVAFGPGWSLAKGLNYGAEAAYNNIGGVGRQASIRGSISEERDQAVIGPRTLLGRKLGAGFTEPYVLDLPLDATIRAKQEAKWGGQLWEINYGAEVELSHNIKNLPLSSISIFYGQKIAETEGPSARVDELIAGDVRIGSTGFRFNIDKRDDLKFPTHGWALELESSWARYPLGGDLEYFKWDVTSSRYFALTSNWVFALGVSATSYDGIGRKGDQADILPSQERLQSGGDTVRGYRSGSLGPLVRGPIFDYDSVNRTCKISYQNSPLNGTSRTTVKTEVRHRFNELIAVTGFIDSGNVFLSSDQMSKFQGAYDGPVTDPNLADHPECSGLTGQRSVIDNFGYNYESLIRKPGLLWTKHYSSFGSSLNFLTPIGAVNLTYGLPWREPQSEACKADKSKCETRAKSSDQWYRRGEFLVNVGARF